jgi:hypothetical protein
VNKYFAGHLRRRIGENHNKLLNPLTLRGQSLGDTKYIQLKVSIKQDIECHVCSYCAQVRDRNKTRWITFIVRLLSQLLYGVFQHTHNFKIRIKQNRNYNFTTFQVPPALSLRPSLYVAMSHSVCRKLWTDVSGQPIGLAWPLKMRCNGIHWHENNSVQFTTIIQSLFHVTVSPPGRAATQQAGHNITTKHARRWTDWLTDWLASYGWDKNVCSFSHKDEPLSSIYIDVHDR